jgi:hypothetical protein
MRLHSSVLLLLLLATGIFSATSCAHGDSQVTEKIPVVALKGGGVVYSAFIDYLNKGPRDNDFTKFASNPENFTVSILDRGDKIVYTFILKSYHSGPVLGGPISFSWSKKDGKIERTLRP